MDVLILAAVTGVVVWLVLRYGLATRRCPECNEELPKVRKPQSVSQALWGGWTCPNCGCRTTARGNRV